MSTKVSELIFLFQFEYLLSFGRHIFISLQKREQVRRASLPTLPWTVSAYVFRNDFALGLGNTISVADAFFGPVLPYFGLHLSLTLCYARSSLSLCVSPTLPPLYYVFVPPLHAGTPERLQGLSKDRRCPIVVVPLIYPPGVYMLPLRTLPPGQVFFTVLSCTDKVSTVV